MPTPDPANEHVRWATPAGRWVVLATVLGSGMAFLDGTVVNVALPAIGAEFGAQVSGLQWVVNSYVLVLAALILLGGSLGDRYGRRRIFQIGVVGFAAASALSAVAVNVEMLIAARALQGVGGALLTPGSLAILEASFTPADRSKAIGAWSALTGVAAALGPLLGGVLVDRASWRWVFLLNVPLAVVVIVTTSRHVPESRDPTATGRLDVPGAVLATVALAALTAAMIEAGGRGWTDPVVMIAVLVGAASAVAFVHHERHGTNPMVRMEIFRSRQFTGANLVTVAVYGALGVVFFLLVVHLQEVLGYSAVAAGLASLPVTLLMLGLSARSGALAERIGPRWQLTIGPLLLSGGLLLMLRIGPGGSYVATVLPAVVVLGLGLATTVAPLTATVLAAADDRQAGVASAVNNAVSRGAQLTGVALIPTIAGLTGDAYTDPRLFTDGFHRAMLITAVVAALGGLVGWVTIRNPLADDEPSPEPPCPRYHCAVAGSPVVRPPSPRG